EVDVRVGLLERFRVRLQLVRLQRGVHEQLRLLGEGRRDGGGEQQRGEATKGSHRALPFLCDVLLTIYKAGRCNDAPWPPVPPPPSGCCKAIRSPRSCIASPNGA